MCLVVQTKRRFCGADLSTQGDHKVDLMCLCHYTGCIVIQVAKRKDVEWLQQCVKSATDFATSIALL